MNWEWLSYSSFSGMRAEEPGCTRGAASMDLVGEGLAVAVEERRSEANGAPKLGELPRSRLLTAP